MFEKVMFQCPACSAEVRQELEDKDKFDCMVCRRRFKVMFDKDSGKAGFIEIDKKKIPEPLFLPRGSIRSLVTVAMAFSCWILIFKKNNVPDYLFSLILTIIGYYFGFRKKIKSAGSRIFDASARVEEPLFLPHGIIRLFLITGFVVSGFLLYGSGRFKELKYLEFFIILFGLISGYIFARIFSKAKASSFYIFVNHVKGAFVLASAAYLVFLFLTGSYMNNIHIPLLLSAVISFYFGSRS